MRLANLMYRVELWRQNPPRLLLSFLHDDFQSGPLWTPSGPGELPVNWPEGYEWRRIPLPGSGAPAATWPADWRMVREYDQPARFLVVPPGES